MAKIKTVLQTENFKKTVKKLHKNQKADLDKAVRALMESPTLGEQKKGDLSFMRVYKFKMVKQLTLLGYSHQDESIVLELIALGSHENFYRNVKKNLLAVNGSEPLLQEPFYSVAALIQIARATSIRLACTQNFATFPCMRTA